MITFDFYRVSKKTIRYVPISGTELYVYATHKSLMSSFVPPYYCAQDKISPTKAYLTCLLAEINKFSLLNDVDDGDVDETSWNKHFLSNRQNFAL